jgi:class 3 adenylate cyclase/pimeloyl-ACP methyl ester carboxylesterase
MERMTGFAHLNDSNVAYQLNGKGPIDLVATPGSFVGFDIAEDDPMVALYYERLASIARVIRFDRRGSGSSDPVPLDAVPGIESYVEETLAVMDAVGSDNAAVMAGFDAGPMGIMLAAAHPERVSALVLVNTTSRFLHAEDYAIGVAREAAAQIVEVFESTWGSEAAVGLSVPSRAGDPRFVRWFAKLQRLTISPKQAAAYMRAIVAADVRALLPSVTAPTLVVHREGLQSIPLSHAEYMVENIPAATLLKIPGQDAPMMWEGQEVMLEALEEFVAGIQPKSRVDRVISTVLFMDVVDSTRRAEELGDRRWHALLEVHDELAAKATDANGGRLVKNTGDGFMATFDGPGRAILAASQICARFAELGVTTRTGIHTGEVEMRDDDIAGVAVHLASRIMNSAEPGEIWVSSTVKDLVVGSDFRFTSRGDHTLKGIADEWRLFSVETSSSA